MSGSAGYRATWWAGLALVLLGAAAVIAAVVMLFVAVWAPSWQWFLTAVLTGLCGVGTSVAGFDTLT